MKPSVEAISLYRRCCSDDRATQEQAYQALDRYLLRIALSRLRTKPYLSDLAQECTQQALFIIWQKLSENNGPAHPEWFMTWSARIVTNKLIDQLRRRNTLTIESLNHGGDENEPWALQLPDQDTIAPDAHALNQELRDQLIAIIGDHPQLSDDAKIVLLHGFLLERNDEELAHALGKERTTIRVLRSRSLKKLRNDSEYIIASLG